MSCVGRWALGVAESLPGFAARSAPGPGGISRLALPLAVSFLDRGVVGEQHQK
jgi:hypothetical protein